MGLANSSVGLTSGIAFFVVPQLLAAQHVSEATIAGITAAAMSSNFWPFIFGPMLDVRFSRRTYATIFAALASLLIILAITNLHRLPVLEAALVLAVAAAMLYTTALGGWLSTVCPPEDKNKLSAWINIAVIAGTGVTSGLGGELIRNLTQSTAACALGFIVFIPTTLFLFIPSTGPDGRLASESFTQFARELLQLLRRREVVLSLLLLLSPCSSFALTNLLGAMGEDFHASAREVSLAGGLGAVVSGIAGCLLFPIIAKGRSLLFLYLADGVLGSLFTLTLILLPHTAPIFLLALLGEYLFQAFAFSIQVGIMFETIGQSNPFAATTFTVLSASTYVPITYMMVLDGKGYSHGVIAGTFATDAAISIASCLLIGLLLFKLNNRRNLAPVPLLDPVDALSDKD